MANYDVSYIFKVVDKFSPVVKEMSKNLEDLQSGLDKVQKKLEITDIKENFKLPLHYSGKT